VIVCGVCYVCVYVCVRVLAGACGSVCARNINILVYTYKHILTYKCIH